MHSGQNHDQGGLMSMRYYQGGGASHDGDWKLRCLQLQKRYQVVIGQHHYLCMYICYY